MQNDNSLDDVAALQAQFEALDIPPNIDPALLALWMRRERAEIERKKQKSAEPPPKCGRSLKRLFAAYIGIAVMCLTVILGLVQGLEPESILKTACIAFLVYTVVGAVVGVIAERCVSDSVETLIRDIVNRTRETGAQNIETEGAEN